MRRTLLATSILATLGAAALGAQSVQVTSPAQHRIVLTRTEDDGRAMIGVSTSSGSKRDTLGVLVSSVAEGGPAEKAGLTEGDRLQSINGVSLRVGREDAGDGEMGGIMQRRLTRELGKVKAGDEVALQVWHDGASKSYKVKTVAADDLSPRRRTADERAVLGISFGLTGSKRDTAGVFVNAVTEDGPAEKAGIIEGERLAAVNGISLKVPKEDLEDGWASSSRLNRLSREVAKAKPGDVLELTVVSGGRTRVVKVTTAKASSLKGAADGGFTLFRSPDGVMAPMAPLAPLPPMAGGTTRMPAAPRAPTAPQAPAMWYRSFDDAHGDVNVHVEMDGVRREIERVLREELPRVKVEMHQGLEQAHKELQAARMKIRTTRTVRM